MACALFVAPSTATAAQFDYEVLPGSAISDFVCTEVNIPVPDSFTLSDLNVGLNLNHTYRGDLTVTLAAPDGTTVTLYNKHGSSGDNLDVHLDDAHASGISGVGVGAHNTLTPFYEYEYRPYSPLSGFNNKAANGTWTLEVCDGAGGDQGTIKRVALNFADGGSGGSGGVVGNGPRAFQERQTSEFRGNFEYVGNTLLQCTSGCVTNNHNHSPMSYVDIDGNGATFNSSSAQVSLPVDAEVTWAGLYWGGVAGVNTSIWPGLNTAPDLTKKSKVDFKVPGGNYAAVNADLIDTISDDPTSGWSAYQAFADVTDVVQSAGAGAYTVANVQLDSGGGNDTTAFTGPNGGWNLVVFYRSPSEKYRRITLWDGYDFVYFSDANHSFTIDSILTPPMAGFETEVAFTCYDGEVLDGLGGGDGDFVALNAESSKLSNALNPSTNVCNGTISKNGSNVTSRTPALTQNWAFDVDRFSTTSLPANANNVTAIFGSDNEGIWFGNIILSSEIFAPPVAEKSFQSAVMPANVEQEMTITLQNTNASGSLAAISFADSYPAGLTNAASNVVKANTCGGTLTANVNANSLSFSGGTLNAGGSCSITVNVVAAASAVGGTLENCTGPISTTSTPSQGESTCASASVTSGSYDYGDAPDSYGDAAHLIDPDLFLGATVPDAEPDSQHSYNAYGDGDVINDGSGTWYMSGDEDGAPSQPVSDYIPLFPVLKMTATTYTAGFTVNNAKSVAATLYGWIDFDQDGVFSADEAASANVPASSFNSTINLNWNVPVDIDLGTTFIRLRLTTDGSVDTGTPTGVAADGEVEDFTLAVAMDIPPESNAISITTGLPQACQSVIFSDDFNDLPMGSFIGPNRGSATSTIRNWTVSGGGGDTYARTEDSTGISLGTSIYFGNGAVRRVSPALGSGGFAFDANGRMTTTLDAVELRDNADDSTPGTTLASYGSASDWGPQAVTMSRTFTTEAGKSYRLYFKAIPEDVGGSFVAGTMRLDLPGGSIHFKIPGSNEGEIDYSVEFTALASTSTITFVNYGHVNSGNSGWCDPASEYNNNPWCTAGGGSGNGNELIIDNVKVTEAACVGGNITGAVYTDNNSNDSFDAGDAGLGSITVNLLNAADGSGIATTSTVADGTYSFANLDPALTYKIEVDTSDSDLPAGYTIGTTNPLTGVSVTAGNITANQNFGFDSGPVTELVCADGSAPFILDWSAVSWTDGDTANTYNNFGGSGHNLTINWRTLNANFRSGRPRIANDPAECPTVTGDYCAASTANVSSLTAEHAVEVTFSPAVKGMDVTIGDLQDKRDGGASANEIIEGVALTKGSATGLTVIPGANITTGSVRTDYAPTTSGDGDDNSIRYIWNNTTDVSNVEFTLRNDNAGPGIYGNALSFNLSGIAFCPATPVSGCSTVVTTTNDSNSADDDSGSLRDAIECANSNPGPDTITFNMPTTEAGYNAGTGVWTLTPATLLPSLTDTGTTVDATTQPGSVCGDLWAAAPGRSLKVQLDGANLPALHTGLQIDGSDFALRGLAVTNFTTYGVRTTSTATNARLTCNHLGVAADGLTRGSNSTGLSLAGTGNRVGGITAGDGNIISGNSAGGGMVLSGAHDTTVQGNFIGLAIDGSTPVNNGIGIWNIRSRNALVGGTTAAERNLISGNSNAGLTFIGPDNTGNLVQGNYIGTTKTGLAAAGNRTGINFGDFSNGITVSGNVISGNDNSGIGTGADVGEDSHSNTISNNLVGLDKDGVNPLPNQDGITLYEVDNFLIQENTIANNTRWGIMLQDGADAVTISRNRLYNNTSLGIELQSHDGSFATSVGVTVNDASDTDSGPNSLLNFPVLSRVVLSGSDLIISGCAPAGAVVEFFEADVSPGGAASPGDNRFGLTRDYGEGQTYLFSLVEDGLADSDPGSCSVPGEDGNDHTGMNGFYFSVPAPVGITVGDILTTTATLGGTETSEFGPVTEISDAPPVIGGGSCPAAGGTDILFIVDNSGSITPAEYAEFSQTIQDVGTQFLAENATNRIAVAHFGGPSDSLVNGGQYVYIERDFSSAAMTAPVRQFGHSGAYNSFWMADHLAGAIEHMRYALDGDVSTSSNMILSPLKETSRDKSIPLQIVLMTDAARYLDNTPTDISMLIDPAGSGAEPNDGSDYTVYNQLKDEGVSFSVVSFNPYAADIAASAAIASVGGNYTGAVDVNTADPEGSQATPRRYISVTSGFSLTTDQIIELTETTAICGSSISGRVFEDLLYGGGNGRSASTAGTTGLAGVAIEVYDNSGTYIGSVLSNATGAYRLPSLPDGDYYVRAVNETVRSSRTGSDGSERAVMTYRSNGVTAVTNEVGGRYPGATDGGTNAGTATLDTSSFTFSGGSLDGEVAQSVQPVSLNGNSVQNADFGFNFNTIVNANAAGQGSLQQFIYNSNLLDSTGIAQSLPAAVSGDYTAGDTVAVFMIPAGLLTSGEAIINPVAELSIDQARTVIDGRVQIENIGSGNIIIRGDGSTLNSGVRFTELAGGSVLRDVTVDNFGGSGITIYGSGSAGTGVTVKSVVISDNNQYGILLENAAANNKIIANTIQGNTWAGIANDASGNNTFSRNSITDNGGLGIDLGSDGVTANTDADVWLNYPEVGSGSSISSNGTMIVSYDFELDVPANAEGYRVEFFSNTAADPSGHGEGEVYLGFVDITHAGGGSQNFKGSFNANQAVAEDANISLTLTEKTGADTLGATSEFSGINNGGLSVCTDLLADPSAPLPNVVLNENSTTVTYLEALDADGNPVTYVISGGADSKHFVIRPAAPGALFDCVTIEFVRDDNVVITRSQPLTTQATTRAVIPQLPPPGDYEAPMDSGRDNTYDLEITVTDSDGNEVTKTVSVVVRDVNERPYISAAAQIDFEEQQDVSNIVIDLESYDPDADDAEGSGLTYSISGGVDATHFIVDRLTGELRFKASPNYDLPADSNHDNDYVLDVRVTDDQGLSGSKTLTVTVTDNPDLGGDVRISVKALLQGAYKTTDGLMTDNLRASGVLPVSQPYTAAPFNYPGNETINLDKITVTGSEAVVDWVLIELRSSDDPTVIVAAQSALILRNGNVADAQLTGKELSFTGVAPGSYYVSLRHRNHLGVMTASPVALSNRTELVDFTDPETEVYGTHSRIINGAVALLWTGDINQDDQLILSGQGSDMNLILSAVLTAPGNAAYNSSYQVPGYYAADLNMDGKIIFTGPANDANVLLGNILLHPGNSGFASNFIAQGGMP
ncbi:MAG: right-handed parallel beta-helix repeat-containing protein [Thiolinea sp.]